MSGGDSSRPEVGDSSPTAWWKTRNGLVLCGFLIVAGFYLLSEHTAHLLGVLPWLLFAACPLMHMFMHHGHGGHAAHGHGAGDDPSRVEITRPDKGTAP